MVGGEVLEQGVDGGGGDDHAIAGGHKEESGEIKVAREGEGHDGGEEADGAAEDKASAALVAGERGDSDGAEKRAGAGAGHEQAQAGFGGVEDVAGEVRDEGEIRDGEQAADRDQKDERGHFGMVEDVGEALFHLLPDTDLERRREAGVGASDTGIRT